MALSTIWQPVDDDSSIQPEIDSDHISIEGADVLVRKIRKEEKTIRPEDYLGIGNPLIYR